MADQIQWQISGDYFENCSCTVVCPCLVSTAAPLTSRPTEGVCNVPLIFHIDSGRYGDGAAGGPMANFAPLISKNLGVRKVPITYRIEGKRRSAEIPGVLHMSVDPLPTAHPSGEMWANVGHPVSPDKLALAMGASGNTFSDHGMRWDNSGKNGHYAPIRWSNQS
jgi:hypothetical protein